MSVGHKDVLAGLFVLPHPKQVPTPQPSSVLSSSNERVKNFKENYQLIEDNLFTLIKIKALLSNTWNIQQLLLNAWHGPTLKKDPATYLRTYLRLAFKSFFKHKTTPF